ncbi:hypothetical protein [Mesorhizobium sp. DCY119]|uniref:hypothetical protein n=1 Tax=Mesorhizobium sp. DCY119 TaxID=2108445 RepID=UPI000E70B5DE|nr:hypothetical protein [Mesorhizobium sp. DCY119]RJG45587.1 hypothetical protein D3Y55_15895 [Mesorhizobium sp. DCY119]
MTTNADKTKPKLSIEDDLKNLIINLPLYSEIKFSNDDRKEIYEFFYSNFQVDCYCVSCKKESTFKTIREEPDAIRLALMGHGNLPTTGTFMADLICQRADHLYQYIFYSDGEVVCKIGQFPSMEDIAGSDIERFRPVLEKGYYRELHRAGGLASHGIGIGSFVYLRRIFERLISTHYQRYVEKNGEVEGFSTMRIVEKIGALRDILPDALVKHKAAYGILSKGIHELDEDTCRRYFPIVRAAIISILEEDLQALEKQRAADELTKALGAIAGEISAKSSTDVG